MWCYYHALWSSYQLSVTKKVAEMQFMVQPIFWSHTETSNDKGTVALGT